MFPFQNPYFTTTSNSKVIRTFPYSRTKTMHQFKFFVFICSLLMVMSAAAPVEQYHQEFNSTIVWQGVFSEEVRQAFIKGDSGTAMSILSSEVNGQTIEFPHHNTKWPYLLACDHAFLKGTCHVSVAEDALLGECIIIPLKNAKMSSYLVQNGCCAMYRYHGCVNRMFTAFNRHDV
ncbi:Similar to hypothetical protein [Podospora anserina S mat+]; acc. no. XP_001903708 [Pyronema omphalodes CBS 100304]|uniref:Uncharacterized protein n=1 Tax=Pyronema omphalodes (strain CBS 100304) TaxID=1076935 RepID=U4L4W5_PYROM|nr:Similar to hypothetical protein [Podospora anserina S mat+]; acc. no. XP_001903708 [Pyronema omphalodes CBS 100304]